MSTMFIHKTQIGRLPIAVGCILWLLADPATAMPRFLDNCFAHHTAAEIFFEAGDQKIEQEIRLLNRRQSKDAAQILRIDGQTKLNEKELETLDNRYPHPQPQHRQKNTD